MPSPPPFPTRIEDLTADFVSNALDLRIDDVSAERIGADRGMLGEIFHLTLDTPHAEPPNLIAKFAALRDETLASAKRGRTYERELLCFEQLLGRTPVRTPACYGTWYDEATAHFLMLQDYVPADPFVDQIAGIAVDEAERVLSEIAGLHARWWNDAELTTLDWLPRLDAPTRIDNLTTLARIGWGPLVDLIADEMPAVPDGFGDALPQRIEGALRSLAALPSTLVHCDLRPDNLLFDPGSGSVTIVDWQGCGSGPAAFDVAYFIVQSLTVEDRRAHESRLLEHWCHELRAAGVDTDRALDGYAESLWYGLVIACALPIVGDPSEQRVRTLAATIATRSLAALADHDHDQRPT